MYNLLTLISSVIAIVSPFITGIIYFIRLLQGKEDHITWLWICVGLTAVVIILALRCLKYRTLSRKRMKSISGGMHTLTHKCRDTFFEIQHEFQKKTLGIDFLTEKVEICLQSGLDALCTVLEDFTGQTVSACIKLIEYSDSDVFQGIDEDNARIRVFCRSTNSDPERKNYDHNPERKEMYLKDDTALLYIVGKRYNHLNHFYQGDLDRFIKSCEESQVDYKCPTQHREHFYNGTMILPIRVLSEKLYYFKNRDTYHVIGFLCVDSLSKSAFRPDQESYNCAVGNAFADEFYVILNRYRRYLVAMQQEKQIAEREAQKTVCLATGVGN